jgi:16S rRNA (cytidine1402-2'-O)-methyltransferase
MPGTLFVVATPIGNLEDVTARALRVLREAAIIAAEDTRRTAQLLARYDIHTPTTSLHEHNEGRKAPVLIGRLQRGEHVALVSDAGTPTISDPGSRLIKSAIDAGVRVEAIPGPSAALAALTVSGFSTETFTFLGFPPTRSRDRSKWFDALKGAGRTVVFFEAPHRIRRTLEDLQVNLGDVAVCVARELTKRHEKSVRGPISEVLMGLTEPRGEFTVVVNGGQLPNITQPMPASDDTLLREFGVLTNSTNLNRREIISELARRFGASPRDVYAIIERGKLSGK